MHGREVKRLLPLVVVATLLLASCGGDDAATTGTTTTTTAADTTTSVTSETADVGVWFVTGEKVATAGRSLATPEVATGAVEALLEGPTDFEAGLGMTSAIPAGTELLGIDIADGAATVDLSGDFGSGGGSLSMQLRVAQVVFTVTQLDEVDTVTIWLDGKPATEGIGGEGVPATDLDRSDVEAVTPFVLILSPTPGQTVTSPLTITGISNTFEATVQYTVTDPDGLILDEGFTTATAGNGVWGEFSITVDIDLPQSGLGAVIAFQDDMESGGQRDVYEVPVRFG